MAKLPVSSGSRTRLPLRNTTRYLWENMTRGWNRKPAVTAAMLALFTSCSERDPVQSLDQDVIDIIMTRADGTVVQFADDAILFIWCGSWEENVPVPSLRIVLGGPGSGEPYLQLRAVLDNVTVGEPLSFPNTFVFDQPKDVDVFVFDPPNEASTQTEGTGLGGQITFQELACEAADRIEFTIDATLGSEFGNGPAITVSGRFRASIA
jgi:hypothetical protein